AFHDPADANDDETFGAIGLVADLEAEPAVAIHVIVQQVLVVAVVGEDDIEAGGLGGAGLGEQELCAPGVGEGGGRGPRGQQQPHGVHQDVTLPALDLLAPVGAHVLAGLGHHLDALAVHAGRAGGRLAAGLGPDALPQGIDDSLPGAVVLPLVVVVVHRRS